MKDGHVDSFINKTILFGAAGTGKSSFMEIVTDNSPPDIRRSTPLASRPVPVFQMDVVHKRFKKLTLLQRKEMIAKAMANVKTSRDEEEDSSSCIDSILNDKETAGNKHVSVSTEAPTRLMSSTQDPDHKLQPVAQPTSSPGDSRRNTSHALLESACDGLVQLIEQCSRTGEASYNQVLQDPLHRLGRSATVPRDVASILTSHDTLCFRVQAVGGASRQASSGVLQQQRRGLGDTLPITSNQHAALSALPSHATHPQDHLRD